MEEFYINPVVVYRILTEKGVKHLFHANTVLTSLTFINQNALLSRNHVEVNGLAQTEQKSDNEDRKFNVWDDVFLDGLDLHEKYSRPNKYGPILFVMKLELLLAPSLPPLLVTKKNPWYWKDHNTWGEKYFNDSEEIKAKYLVKGQLDSQIMFTLRSPNTFIKLNKYLVSVMVDKAPIIVSYNSNEKKKIRDQAFDKIREALVNNSLGHIPMKLRHSGNLVSCCYFDYIRMSHFDFIRKFKSS